jgi:hypothetical protein
MSEKAPVPLLSVALSNNHERLLGPFGETDWAITAAITNESSLSIIDLHVALPPLTAI